MMITDKQINEIVDLLKNVEIELDKEKFKNIYNSLGDDIDFSRLSKNIDLLINLITNTSGDYEGKRDTYDLLRHIHEIGTIVCLADFDTYFKTNLKEKLSDYEKTSYWLDAALVGAKSIANELFNKDDPNLNPQKNTYFISYAICSQDTEWVKTLIKDWNIDITNKEYCFEFYAKKLNNQELINYYNSAKSLEEKSESSIHCKFI